MTPWLKALGIMVYLVVVVPASGFGVWKLLRRWEKRKGGPDEQVRGHRWFRP